MKPITVLAAAALWAAFLMPANAATWSMDPPPKYDHPFLGRLKIIEHGRIGIIRACGYTIGCALVGGDRGTAKGTCTIHVIKRGRGLPGFGIVPREDLLRHEIGHCNGWPANHPGGRWRRV